VAALVREGEVHRDVYVDPEIFTLEMRHLFANTWVFVGHESQIPSPGDYYSTSIGDQPVLMVRHTDHSINVLYNRCPHKGTRIVADTCGNAGKFFRCPYHAWHFRTDGALHSVPLSKGYRDTGFESSHAVRGMTRIDDIHDYRGFVFARLRATGPSFEDFFGESLSSIDNMVDRSPVGRLEVAGGTFRYMHRCNWKMLVENQTDACHPMVVHDSASQAAADVAGVLHNQRTPELELLLPFASPYDFYEKAGIRVWANGHGHTGVSFSVHSGYSSIPEYMEQMVAAYGRERAERILGENRHNTIYFPNLMIKGPIQLARVFKPVAADRTLVESWSFRLVGAPDALLERTLAYNRLINAPTSIVGHDDWEIYRRAQEGLHAAGNEWVNLQRLYDPVELEAGSTTTNGTSEIQMRNQFRSWARFMTMTM